MLEYQLTCLYVVIATRVLLTKSTNLYHEKQQVTGAEEAAEATELV